MIDFDRQTTEQTLDTIRARILILGYRQIAGVDLYDIHAPVIGDMALRVLLVLKVVMQYEISSVDMF